MIAFSALFSAISLQAADILTVNFNNQNVGTYTASDVTSDWKNAQVIDGINQGRVQVVSGSEAYSGNSLKVFYPKGTFGVDAQGCQFKVSFSSFDSLYVEYRIKFNTDFTWVKGGKIPGLCGGACNTGGEKPTGYDGWSTRYMWRENGKLVVYAYHVNQATEFGDDLGCAFMFKAGTWHTIRQFVKMNTGSLTNGAVRVWADGNEVLNWPYLCFRKTDAIKINMFYFSTFFGGSDATWASARDEYVYFDDFRIFTTPPTDTRSPAPGKTAAGPMVRVCNVADRIEITSPVRMVSCALVKSNGVHSELLESNAPGTRAVISNRSSAPGVYYVRVRLGDGRVVSERVHLQ